MHRIAGESYANNKRSFFLRVYKGSQSHNRDRANCSLRNNKSHSKSIITYNANQVLIEKSVAIDYAVSSSRIQETLE